MGTTKISCGNEDARIILASLIYTAHSYSRIVEDLELLNQRETNAEVEARGDAIHALSSRLVGLVSYESDSYLGNLDAFEIQSLIKLVRSDDRLMHLANLGYEDWEDEDIRYCTELIGQVTSEQTITWEINAADLDGIVKSLSFCESAYLGIVSSLTKLDRDKNNRTVLQRSYRCDDLRKDIESAGSMVLNDGSTHRIGLMAPKRLQMILQEIVSDDVYSALETLDFTEWKKSDLSHFQELIKRAWAVNE